MVTCGGRHIYTIILLKYVCLSVLANSTSQFLLDRLGRQSISCHEFASQFGLAIVLYPKNTQNYRKYRVAHANVYLNAAVTGHCSPVTVDRSPVTTYMSGDNSDHNEPSGVTLSQNREMQQVKMATMRDYIFTAWKMWFRNYYIAYAFV